MKYTHPLGSYVDIHPVSGRAVIKGVPGANVNIRNVTPYLDRLLEIEP